MVDEYKIFNITGGAAAEYLGGAAKQKRVRKTAKASIKQEGGSAMPSAAPLVLEPLQQQYALTAPSSSPSAPAPAPSSAPSSASSSASSSAPSPAPSALVGQNGGTKIIKVELKRKSAKKHVKLHPKKDGIKKLAMSKKARKVSIGLSSLHKRVRRAQKTEKKVKEMSLEDLKKELIAKKLIKVTSKAPESVLRQIAADSRIMEKKAL
jgi:hypothetical protein